MTQLALLRAYNGKAVPLPSVPTISLAQLAATLVAAPSRETRVSALFGIPAEAGIPSVMAVLSSDEAGHLELGRVVLESNAYPSLTPSCTQVHFFERELAETWGLVPVGHPWLKPVRFSHPSREFYRVEGDEVHEVAVGPVHAGVIEPGHFRFQCHGEEVLHLEISLGYQHRGVERALVGGPTLRSVHYAETLAGDTTIGHATAFCQMVEALSGCQVSARAQALRAIALELERLANHTGDLGALAGDIGFLPTASYCGRLRGDFLNLTAELCGNRFGRGFVRPGGVTFDVDGPRMTRMLQRLEAARADTVAAAELLWNAASVQARFEDIGRLSMDVARDLGMVGLAARASGLGRDVRKDQPAGLYRFMQIPIAVLTSGDVYARARLRQMEIERSVPFVRELLGSLPAGNLRTRVEPLVPDQLAVTLVEGWRGEICHVACTDAAGRFVSYKIVDPSFHNWTGLAMAMRGEQISDFPVCNKSFSLSYCGHDL